MASAVFTINGGSPGVKAAVSASSTVNFAVADTTGVKATEWAIVMTDETSLPSNYTVTPSGSYNTLASTTALTTGKAAIMRCRVWDGLKWYEATGKFYVTPEVGCTGETRESDATHGVTGLLNTAIRLGGSLTPTFTSATATSFVAIGSSPAASGALRMSEGGVIRYLTAAGTVDALTVDAGGNVIIGESADATTVTDSVKTGGRWQLNVNGAEALRATEAAITIPAAAPSYGLLWTQDGSSTGGTLTIEGQQGASGNVGGKIVLAAGKGGTPATNLAGGIDIDLGRLVGGASSFLQLLANSDGVCADLRGNGYFYLRNGAAANNGIILQGTGVAIVGMIGSIASLESATTGGAQSQWVTDGVRNDYRAGVLKGRCQYAADVATSDATVTTAWSMTLTDNTTYTIVAYVNADSSGADSAGYVRAVTVKRAGGGATIVGAVTSVHTAEDAGAAAWDCTFDVSSNDVRLRVTGANATNITWSTKAVVTAKA